MKCLLKYFFQIAFCLSIVLTLNSQAAATSESTFLDVDGLLQNPLTRKIISGAVQGAYPSSSTLHPFGNSALELTRLQTILPAREAIVYQSTVWPKVAPKGMIISEFTAGQTVIYISFPPSSEKGYRELDTSKTWCPRDATHVSQPSSRFLAGFFEGAPGDPTQYELTYTYTVLALYLQNAIWDIITPLISVTERNYNFVVTGHGPGGVAAQMFSLLLVQRIQEMKINGIVNVIACGSPRAFKYHAGEYVRNRLGPNHIKVFSTRKEGMSDPFISYPATLFSGSTEEVGSFTWETRDDSHALAKANNVWTHPVHPTALPVELSLADGLKGTVLSSVGVYAKALSTYVPPVVSVDAGKAVHPLSTASAHGGVLPAVLASPAAGGAAGGGGASASAITEYKTTPTAPGKAAGGSGASAAPIEHILTPSAIAGAEDKGEGANTSEGGGWASSLLGVSNWWAPAPPPATVVLPPYPPPATAASGGAGHAGSAAAGAGSTEGEASPGMIAAATLFLGSYVPPAVKDRLATAAEAVASGVEVAAAVGGKLLEEVARETGKVVFSRSLADQTLIFEDHYGIFQNALQHNEDAFEILHGFIDKDPIAKGYVAICLAFGFGTHVNLKLAEEYAKEVEATIAKPAFLDVPDAQILHGLMLETGLGTTDKYPDIKVRRAKAKALYERVCLLRPAEAYFRLGELARAEGDVKEAKQQLKKAAGKYNHPGALNSLAELYYLARKTEKAYTRFKLAITIGNSPAAKYNLGRLYYEQKIADMPDDERISKARSYLSDAAAQGQMSAHTLLGSILYEEGNYAGALSHFIKATVITSSPSTSGFFNIFKSMETAAAEAHFMLYLMYKTGHGTVSREPDRAKGLEHLREAETLRHEDALALSSIDRDLATVVRKIESFYNLATKYYMGATVPLDLAAAGIFFSEAASIVLPGAGSATITPAAKLSLAKAAFASVVVKLEMLGAPATVAPAPHTSAGAAGGAGASAATMASPKGASVTSGKIGAGAGSATTAGPSPGIVTAVASFMATPPPGAGIGTKPTSLSGATSPSVAVPKDISGDIQKLLENAKAGGLAEADSLLARLRTESLDKVARSIYVKRHPRPGETLRIDPFEAAAK